MTKSIIDTAFACICGIHGSFDIATAQLLMAVTAIFIPLAALATKEQLSVRQLCKILGINCQSKFVKEGLENCKAYNEFLKFEVVIIIGEKVVCWDGKGTGNGTLKDINPYGSIIITLHPWHNNVEYK